MANSSASSERFDQLAAQYRASEVHSGSPALDRLRSLFPTLQSICDVGCGAGHAGLTLATANTQLIAVDPAPQMLEQVHQLAAERGIAVQTVQALAESIPLPSASFDLVVTRWAAHHFADLDAAFREMARLVRPGGHLTVIDLEGDDDPNLDAFNHEIEMLHDPTHVRSYTVGRWKTLAVSNGLQIEETSTRNREFPSGLTIERWCELGRSGDEALQGIRKRMEDANDQILASLDIAKDMDGRFRVPVRTFLLICRKPELF